MDELVARFLTAFENLDLDAFMACFAPSASAFFPPPEPPHRHDGRDAIRERFTLVFAAIRASAGGGPPYHRLPPVDLSFMPLGDSAAVATFHLVNEARLARRSLILHRLDGRWLIVHLHASTVPRPGG